MARRDYDEIATIRRDSIDGQARYAPTISDMHFGAGHVCHSVGRQRWTAQTTERGLVYCASGHCILVPTVCRNVSRIERVSPARRKQAEAPTPAPAATMVSGPGAAGGAGGVSEAGVVGHGTAMQVTGPYLPAFAANGTTPATPALVPDVNPAVPEPSRWALTLAGIGFVALIAARRRRRD